MSRGPSAETPAHEPELDLSASKRLLWPWLIASTLCLLYGVYLLAPDVSVSTSTIRTATPAEAPVPVVRVSQAPVNLNPVIACVDSEATSFAWAAHALSQRVDKATGGRLKLRFAGEGVVDGKKYDELAIIHEVQVGHMAMAIVTSSPLSNIDPDFEIFDLPFLFDNAAEADRVLLGAVGRNLLKGLDKSELKGLASFDLGFRIFTTASPMPDLADFKNKKIRVMQSSTAIAMVRLLGSEPVASAVDKIYQMGKEGYIDGADRTYPTFWDFKLYEVQHYITETYHSYPIKVLIANPEWFASLSKDEQTAVTDALPSLEREQRSLQRSEEQRIKKQCIERGIKVFELDPQQREVFRQACKPLYGEYEKLRGRYILQEVEMTIHPR